MSFFERYFEALDGPDPHVVAGARRRGRRVRHLVGARRPIARARQLTGGLDELRGDDRRRRQCGLGAPRPVLGGRQGGVEFAHGETRYGRAGERIGTFLCSRAARRRRARCSRYMVARRSPAIRQYEMHDQRDFRSPRACSTGRRTSPRLLGSACRALRHGDVSAAGARARAARRRTMDERAARAARARCGRWTIQCFPPKSPPYAGAAEDVRAVRRRLRRAAGRGARRGPAHRVRSRAAADRHADGADADPRARGPRHDDLRIRPGGA